MPACNSQAQGQRRGCVVESAAAVLALRPEQSSLALACPQVRQPCRVTRQQVAVRKRGLLPIPYPEPKISDPVQELLERLDARCKACASQLDGLKRSIAMIDDEERVSLMLVRARIKPSFPWSTRACV